MPITHDSKSYERLAIAFRKDLKRLFGIDISDPEADELTESFDRDSFMGARISPVIDYIVVEPSHLAKRFPLKEIKYIRRNGEITIHDPQFKDLLIIKGYKVKRIEISLDIYVDKSLPFDEQERVRKAIFRFLAQKIWPFANGSHVYPDYRVSSNLNEGGRPVRYVDAGGASDVELRLPNPDETFYVGDSHTFRRFENSTNGITTGAQIRIYIKRIDNRQEIPSNQWRTRIEVTLYDQGLYSAGIKKVDDLFSISFRRALSKYFNLIDLDKLVDLTGLKRSSAAGRGLKGSRSLLLAKRTLAKRSIEEAGVVSLLQWRRGSTRPHISSKPTKRASKWLVPTRFHADTRANERLMEALDNLTRQARGASTRLHTPIT